MNSDSTGDLTGDRVVPTICGACHNSCGMLVHVRDGVIQDIKGNPDHPMNRGTLCVKGRAMAELTRSPQRLKRPLKRVGLRGEGRWQEIPWDEALDLMAARLDEIASQYGPETLLYSCGARIVSPASTRPPAKVELYSQRFAGLGYEPLPTYHEPAESPISTPLVARDYPLIGVNRRPLAYVHYKYRNIPALRKLEPEPCVRLSPGDAGQRGIANGEWAAVSSPRGRIRMKTLVSDKMRDGVVWIDGGWGNPWDYPDANINVLTDNQALDPQAQCASTASFLCQVAKE